MKLSELIKGLAKLQDIAGGEDPVVVVSDWTAPMDLPTKLSTAKLLMGGGGDPVIVLRINVPPE